VKGEYTQQWKENSLEPVSLAATRFALPVWLDTTVLDFFIRQNLIKLIITFKYFSL
jgi:hypothetical protein